MKRAAVAMILVRTLWVLVLGVSACSTGPTIRSHTDPSANLANFKTFNFYSQSSGQANYASFVSRHIQQAVTDEMTARGYTLSDKPDLLVNFHLQTADKLQVQSSPAAGGYYGWRGGYGWGVPYQTDVSSYTEGTLNIDVVDHARNQLLWEGVAIGRIREKAKDDPSPRVKAVVAQIFAEYPARAAPAGT